MNNTKQDAFERILRAKTGSLVDPSEEYLLALLRSIHSFKDEVEQELNKLYLKQEKQRKSA